MATKAQARREAAYHEAGHAVATYFHPLAGKTEFVSIGGDALVEHNLTKKHSINEAAGIHSRGQTIPAIVGRSVDHEQVHHTLIMLLSGYAAGWVFSGGGNEVAKSSKRSDAEAIKHADGSDDFTRCLKLLWDSDPFDARYALWGSRTNPLAEGAPGEPLARGRSAIKASSAQTAERFELLWQESKAFVVEKWPHIQSVADACLRKTDATGDEITEIIERVEERLQSNPPLVGEILETLRPASAPGPL
jgi:hypothetical protein